MNELERLAWNVARSAWALARGLQRLRRQTERGRWAEAERRFQREMDELARARGTHVIGSENRSDVVFVSRLPFRPVRISSIPLHNEES
jgi:hypothetical protein